MYRAAAASVVITPESPMWLAGFSVRTAPSQGRLSDLHAKALALRHGEDEPFVLVTMDLIAVSHDIAHDVAREVQRRHGLPRERILFAVSHTHYGPEVRPDKVPFFRIPPEFAGKIEPYVAELKAKLVTLIDQALSDLRPVRLFARRDATAFAHNRRPHGVGPTDHDVPVMDVIDADSGARRAIVFGYACHNTTIPPEDRRYCGDWAGFAQQHVEDDHPGAVAMFITGAAADQNPEPRGSVDHARSHGRALADAVGRAIASPDGREITGRISAAYEDVPLEFQPIPPRENLVAQSQSADAPAATKAAFLLRALDEGRELPREYPCPVHVVRFGEELLLIALGGEPVVDYAARFKAQFPGPLVWVGGYCNHMFGYLPSVRVQREGGYEGGRATLWSALPMPFTESAEPRVADAVERLVAKNGTPPHDQTTAPPT